MDSIESTLSWHIKFWKISGLYPLSYQTIRIQIVHKAVLGIVYFSIVFYYPISMTIDLLNLVTLESIADNISLSMTLYAILLKVMLTKLRSKDFIKICSIHSELEQKFMKKAFGKQELQIYKIGANRCFYVYAGLYNIINIFAGLSALTHPKDELRYPAYFPFNVDQNYFVLLSLKLYQYFGFVALVYINLFLDTYPPILIYLLKQNLCILSERISSIGNDEAEIHTSIHDLLREAIEDKRTLDNCFNLMSKMISPTMFAMFFNVLINLVCAIILLVVSEGNAVESAFYVLYAGAITLEIAFSCYYGSEFEACSEELTRSIFACNWTNESKEFRKDLMMFGQSCLQQKQFRAGGVVPISLITFQKVLKTSYTYYTVFNQVTNKK